ncbi:hypothetical protein [Flavobacterium sp. Root186]|uniref:hypothetical protein n=1 Tax=Flavobacterium sp. Root186 TaxID=1736485 RepID=UPI0006FAB71B|nr:hypothetical protein [Flavobacterium sp. Root186]KRB55491.1 hypothetical protein ASD98_12490 [Flavobacterium sp. Root186]
MKTEIDLKKQITSKKAIKILKKEGMNVTAKEAEEILFFLRKLANIAVTKYLNDCDSKSKKIKNTQKKLTEKRKTKVIYCKPCTIAHRVQ